MLSFKEGAKLEGLKPEILIGLQVVLEVFRKYGYDLVVTEGTGGNHLPNSLHYQGLALDIRSKNIVNPSIRSKVLFDCVIALGGEYDFIIEDQDGPNQHFHIEYQPKENI